MSLNEILEFLRERSESDEPTAVATLLAAWKSAPRAPGARFAAGAGQATAGSISAGCVEADLREHLAAVAAGAPAKIIGYGVSDEDAAAIGLSCGGEIEVLIRRHDARAPVWTRLLKAIDRGEEAVLVTDVGEADPGRRVLLTAGGDRVGTLGQDWLDRLASTAATAALDGRDRPRLVQLEQGVRVFVEPILRPRRLFAVGATAIAIALAKLGELAGVVVTIVEPRETLARQAVEAGVATINADPATAFRDAGLGRGDAVAVLAHNERLDVAALEAALKNEAGYVGLLGGRRTQQKRRTDLELRGLENSVIQTIHGPIGLAIGAESPGEIGVSILAEVLCHWNRPTPDGT